MKNKAVTMKNRISAIRWALFLPALILIFFVARFVFQLVFPLIQAHLRISEDDLAGMSIMDQEVAFGSYGTGIFTFFFVLTTYIVVPRGKIIICLIILSLGVFYTLGSRDLIVGTATGGLVALFIGIICHRAISFLRESPKPVMP